MAVHAAEFAPAKVNLTLHVTGRRADGYHLLDSLVVFPVVGDIVEAEVAERLSLAVDGPFADHLAADADNLVIRAAALILGEGGGAALRLLKRLPLAAGLGGGSADAAATLRLLSRRRGLPMPKHELQIDLGADIPVCLSGRSSRMRGIGERLTPFPTPPFWLVLVHPGVPLSTAAVFAALKRTDNPPMRVGPAVGPRILKDLFGFLNAQRNDLEAPAIALCPAIAQALAALAAQPGVELARMSGSGGACFGVFATASHADAAARAIRRAEPTWWIVAAPVERNSDQPRDDKTGESV